ncbi:hypothetical protein ACFQFQ_21380 [Sulfitobacter porphyrae]|uniref:Metallo-beta-lactamase domain-containing protein n=1 Tax=Sulfitobacter porphyrae TaxID=1246864 RepID=A0ABW2B880_9RHOB
MERLFDKLHAVGSERLSFAPAFTGRAFLLRRRDGNILMYSSGCIADEAVALLTHGEITRQYINHHHQAMPSCDWISERFGAPLFVPESEARTVAEQCRVGGTFSGRGFQFPDFEMISIRGHSVGSTCFLWDDGTHRYLFTEDSVYLKDDAWTAAVLKSSDRQAYVQSLGLIRELDFDVLVPSMSNGSPIQRTEPNHTKRSREWAKLGGRRARVRLLERGGAYHGCAHCCRSNI